MILVRFFGAAREAVGAHAETRHETTVGGLRSGLVSDHPALATILGHCALLVDGSRRPDDHVLDQAVGVDVLPPFAGG